MSQAYDEIGQGRGVIDLGGMEVWLHKGAMMGANATRATAGGAPTVAHKGGGGSMSMQEQRKALVHAWERTSGAPPRLATLSYPMRRARLREQLRDVRIQVRSLGRGAVQAVKDQIVDLKTKERAQVQLETNLLDRSQRLGRRFEWRDRVEKDRLDALSMQMDAVAMLAAGSATKPDENIGWSKPVWEAGQRQGLTGGERILLGQQAGALRSVRDPLRPSPLTLPLDETLCAAIDPAMDVDSYLRPPHLRTYVTLSRAEQLQSKQRFRTFKKRPAFPTSQQQCPSPISLTPVDAVLISTLDASPNVRKGLVCLERSQKREQDTQIVAATPTAPLSLTPGASAPASALVDCTPEDELRRVSGASPPSMAAGACVGSVVRPVQLMAAEPDLDNADEALDGMETVEDAEIGSQHADLDVPPADKIDETVDALDDTALLARFVAARRQKKEREASAGARSASDEGCTAAEAGPYENDFIPVDRESSSPPPTPHTSTPQATLKPQPWMRIDEVRELSVQLTALHQGLREGRWESVRRSRPLVMRPEDRTHPLVMLKKVRINQLIKHARSAPILPRHLSPSPSVPPVVRRADARHAKDLQRRVAQQMAVMQKKETADFGRYEAAL